MRKAIVLFSFALAAAISANAQEPGVADPAGAKLPVLDTVVVSGIRPGPGLWKVSKGDHALWILGTVSPVPKKMEWYSPRSEAVLRQTQEIIGAPQAGISVGWGSAFKMLFAMPTILHARELPDGKSLHDVLPADLYARWLVLKKNYLGNDKDIENWRPIFAAGKLYGAALNSVGLQSGTGIDGRIGKLAGEYKIKQTPSLISFNVTDPKGLAKSIAKSDMDEVACFRSTLDRLDRDVNYAALRANAWAVGDLPGLTKLVRNQRADPCLEAIAHVEAIQAMGMQNAMARAKAKWLASVDAALAANQTSFSTLPVEELLNEGGLLSQLNAKGYEVAPPEQQDQSPGTGESSNPGR
jgi:hypothetical protein